MTTEQQSREAVVLNHLSAIYPDIEAFYIDLHEHPELSMQEVQTSAKVASRLKDAGLEVTSGVGGTGVVGILRNGPGPTVMVRGDMDALPIEEKTYLIIRGIRMFALASCGKTSPLNRPAQQS